MKALFNSQTKTVGGAAGILVFFSLISGFLGLLSNRLLAAKFGAGLEASVYFAAFKIPDLVYNILISGGILVAFLPIFSEYFAESKEKAWDMANRVLNVFFFLLAVFSAILFILSPRLVELIVPGFTEEAKSMFLILVRILLIQPIILGISDIFSGIINHFYRFLAYSLAPILYNIGIIFGILFLSPYFGIFGVGMGVVLGALLHLLIHIISAVNCGFRYRFLFDFKYPALKRIFLLMIPRIFGIAAGQINLIVITAIASTIAVGSIAIFNFANNLQNFFASVLGVSLATAAFPKFTRLWAEGRKEEFLNKISAILRHALFLVIPAGILTFLLRAQIVGIIFYSGRFGQEEARLTSASLGLFALSIFASALIPFLVRIFFSLQDTKMPTLISLISVAANIGFSFLFVSLLGDSPGAVAALPLAFSISAILQFILLLFLLYKKIGDFQIKDIFDSLKKTLIASFLMGIAVYFSMNIFSNVFLQTVSVCVIGAFVYISTAYFLKSPEIKSLQLWLSSYKYRP